MLLHVDSSNRLEYVNKVNIKPEINPLFKLYIYKRKHPRKLSRVLSSHLFYYLLFCLYDFIFYSYFSLRRLAAASIPANVASPNPASPVLVSVVPVLANLLT